MSAEALLDEFSDDDHDAGPNQIELDKIPRRLWKQTLQGLPRSMRFFVTHSIRDERRQAYARELIAEVEEEEFRRVRDREAARARALRRGVPFPAPDAEHAVARTTVQINVRLRNDDHARLTQAAQAIGLKPTTLARALILNGAAEILRRTES